MSPGSRDLSRAELFATVKVLVVGAGGIGCELLKNLALIGVAHITVVDLDSIDVSNLNRQFLFRKHHVDRSKAEVAAEAAKRIADGCKTRLVPLTIQPLLANIKTPTFSPEFVSHFDAVLSALDNVDARKHLNRLCLSANVPLIEAGSAGYVGQTRVILAGETECYECQKKEAPKSFPVCTIRSTPSTPVHCVHWAKMLHDLLFGEGQESGMLGDLKEKLNTPPSRVMLMTPDAPPSSPDSSPSTPIRFSDSCFRFLFDLEIARQRELEELWKDGRKPPRSIDLDSLDVGFGVTEISNATSQTKLSLNGLAAAFLDACDKKIASGQVANFTKDDPVSVAFVSAAANLRMHNYWIEEISRFQVESIAGAIVPAIATTNAIVAGLQCINLEHVLRNGGRSSARDVWVQYPRPSGSGWILQPSVPAPPKPDCFACSAEFPVVRLGSLDCCLDGFVAEVLRGGLGLEEASVFSGGTMIYDPYDDEQGDAMPTECCTASCSVPGHRTLKDCGVEDGTILQVEDPSAEGSIQLAVLLGSRFELSKSSRRKKRRVE